VARLREFDTDEAVRVATHTFWHQGYQATSIRDLEEATGLTAGSLYKAFGSKRDLFSHCMKHYMVEQSYVAILLRTFDKPIREALCRLFDAIIDSARDSSPRPNGCLVSNLAAELLTVDSELGDSAVASLVEMQKALRFRLTWARDNGELGSDRDVNALGAYFMVMVQGMLAFSTSTRDLAAMIQARDVALATLD
jgi:TetR/AcrR family transcriptional repressor of nem operon